MYPIQLTFCPKLIKFSDINPINAHKAAQTPIIKKRISASKYSNITPVNPIEIAVVPITDIYIIEKSLPCRFSGTVV